MAFGQPMRRRYDTGGTVSVSTSGATVGANPSSVTAANSSVAPFTGTSYETLAPAAPIAPVTSSPQPYSSPIAQVPMSALTGGEGSNGVIASVNSLGVPSGAPPSTPKVSANSAFTGATANSPAPPAAASTGPAQYYAPSSNDLGTYTPLNNISSFSDDGQPYSPYTPAALAQQDRYGGTFYTLGSDGTYTPVTSAPAGNFTTYANRGGTIRPRKLAVGGIPTSEALDPYSTRMSEREMTGHPEGLFGSTGAGRTDVHNMNVPTGSYIVPADVVSGLSEGNTLGGAAIIDRMMHSNPYGIEGGGGRRGGGMGPPRAAPQRIASSSDNFSNAQQNRGGPIKRAAGGATPAKHSLVPIVTAGGEYLIHPGTIIQKFGNLKKGHATLDQFVKDVRAKNVKETSKLPGPKK